MVRVLLTAGYDRALHVVALAELLQRRDHDVAGILVVTPYNVRRLRALVRQRGRAAVASAARRALPLSRHHDDERATVDAFLQAHGIGARTIREWAAERGVPHHVVTDLNDRDALAAVRAARADGVVYGGGGILGDAFLDAARGRVLNAHSGPLPAVRGMNACEWSILLGLPLTVTVHFIDRGIDTGGTVRTLSVPVERGDTLERLRGRFAVVGVQGLVESVGALAEPSPARAADAASFRQCFVLAPALRDLAESKLERALSSKGAGA